MNDKEEQKMIHKSIAIANITTTADLGSVKRNKAGGETTKLRNLLSGLPSTGKCF